MQITLEVKDKEEALNAINNGAAALNTIYPYFLFWSTDGLNTDWYNWWEKHNKDYDKCAELISERILLLKDMYEQIEQQ